MMASEAIEMFFFIVLSSSFGISFHLVASFTIVAMRLLWFLWPRNIAKGFTYIVQLRSSLKCVTGFSKVSKKFFL